MVINYLIPSETQCADEVGEKVLISGRFYMLLHLRDSWGLVHLAWFFWSQIIKFESTNSKKSSNSSLNIEQELNQWLELKVVEGSGIITSDQPGDNHSVAKKRRAGGELETL